MIARSGVRRRPQAAFTLIELLVTMLIVAILAAIAVPSYTAYTRRAQRAMARAALLQTAQSMERYYTANGAYLTAAGAFPLPALAGVACVAVSPADATAVTYCVTGAPLNGGFLLSATPCGDGAICPAAANNGFTDADCDVLTLDNTGARGALGGAAPPGVVDQCWQR